MSDKILEQINRALLDSRRRIERLEVVEHSPVGAGGAHAILSATHTDTTIVAPNDDDVLTWDAFSGTWSAEAVPVPPPAPIADHAHAGIAGDGNTFDAANLTSGASADGDVLTSDGAGGAAWEAVPAGGAHTILSATHTDTNVAAPGDQDVLTWDNFSGKWLAAPIPAPPPTPLADHLHTAAAGDGGLLHDVLLEDDPNPLTARSVYVKAQSVVDTNGNDLYVRAADGNGTGDGGRLILSGGAGSPDGFTAIEDPTTGLHAIFDTTTIAAADRTYTFPNASGTFMLVGDPATAHNLFSATHGDMSGAAAPVDGDTIIGNATPKWSKLAISIPAANVRNVLGIDNAELRPSWKTVLDGTNPAAVGTAASPGTSLVFSHRDHVHLGTHALLDGAITSDSLAGGVVDGDVIIGNVTPKWSRLAITVPAAGTVNFFGVVNAETRPSWKSCSSNPGAAAASLQSDTSGFLTLVKITAVTALHDHIGEATGAHTITLDNTVTMADAKDIILNTGTGTKIGTATNQKLGFYNAAPVVQQLATADLGTALSTLGLRAAGTAYPITTSATTTLTGLMIKAQVTPNDKGVNAATILIADMLKGIVTGTPSAARAYTLDTGANCDAGMTIGVDQAFEWSLININTTAANIITLTSPGADHTIVGATKVPSNSTTTGNLWGTSAAHLRTRKTAANTFVTYRIG